MSGGGICSNYCHGCFPPSENLKTTKRQCPSNFNELPSMKTEYTRGGLQGASLGSALSEEEIIEYMSLPALEIDNEDHWSLLNQAGLHTFDDFWDLPREFVEQVNIRRGGWSGASIVQLPSNGAKHDFYIKRQENQLRFSMRYPLGALTYKYEATAIRALRGISPSVVEMVCCGFRKIDGTHQGFIVTKEVAGISLEDVNRPTTCWRSMLPVLRAAGTRLHEFHRTGWSHGALYPKHMYLNRESEAITLIDFERARKCRNPETAINRDLSQFMKRSAWIPDFALYELFKPYQNSYPHILLARGLSDEPILAAEY